MTHRLRTGAIAVAVWTAVCVTPAATSAANDLGAGPVPIGINPCLLANRLKKGPPCLEPEVLASGDNEARIANRLARARYFIDMQDLPKAREEADLALEIDAGSVTAQLLSARISMGMSDGEIALKKLLLARNQAPDNPDVNATYAYAILGIADIEAYREFDGVLRKHPDHLFSHQQRALLLMQFGRPADALVDFNYLIEKTPTAIYHAQRAEAFLALAKPDAAAADYSEALRLEPDRWELLRMRATAYMAAELPERALKDYNDLLATTGGAPVYVTMDDVRAKTLTERALVFIRLRRFDEASNDILSAVQVGGKAAILRTQVLLRRNGFPDVPLDGKVSDTMKQALTACFGLNACFQGVIRTI